MGILAVASVLLMDTGECHEWGVAGGTGEAPSPTCMMEATHTASLPLTRAPCCARYACYAAAANTYLYYNDIPGLTGEWVGGWLAGWLAVEDHACHDCLCKCRVGAPAGAGPQL